MAFINPGARKPPTQITISIDVTELRRASDENLALYWHVAQANPASIDDKDAGELAMKIGWEVIRRWLGGVEPPLYHHQQRHYWWGKLTKFAEFRGGEWQAKPTETASCSKHQAQLEAGRCRQCTSGVDDSHAITPSSPTTPRCGAPGHTVYRTTDVTCKTCLDLVAESTAAELFQQAPFCTEHLVQLGDSGRCYLCADEIADCPNCGGQHRPPLCADPAGHVDRDPNRVGGYSDAQLDWVACSVCDVKFADNETTAEYGFSPEDGRPLRAHPDCLPESTLTEPSGATS